MTKTKLDSPAPRYLLIVLALAALPRLLLALFEHGVNHPDEIFQVLEPAHRWVFGYGIESWEFQDGARSWFLPGLIALLWKVLALLGASDPLTVVPLLRLPFVAMAVYSAFLAFRLAKALAGDMAGGLAALLAAFSPLALLLDFRTTTEAASAPAVLLALIAIAEGRMLRAGAWAALLVFLRPTNGILWLAMAATLLLQRRFRDCGRLAVGALPVAGAGGLLDWITWGRPFHHLIEYFRFNWIESGAAVFGVQSAWSYGLILLTTAPLLAILVLPASVVLIRRSELSRAPVVAALLYLVAHSALGHKEPRFLLPILPLLAVIASSGLALLIEPWLLRTLARNLRTSMLLVGTAAVVAFSALRARGLTFGDMEDSRGEARDHVLFGKRDRVNHLLVQAGRQADLCGMLILGLMPNELFSGGLTYLHRDVVLVSPPNRQAWATMSQAANYAVGASVAKPPGWRRVMERDGVSLFARPEGCMVLPEGLRPKYARPSPSRAP